MRVDEWLPVLAPEVQERAIDLRPFHREELGLKPEDALLAIQDLVNAGIAILGGELWLWEQGRPVHTPGYLSWHVNRTDEAWSDFVTRAAAEAGAKIHELASGLEGVMVVFTPARA